MKKLSLALLLSCAFSYAAFAQQPGDPCQSIAKISVPINQATSTTLVSGSPGRKNYICGIAVVSPDAEKLSVIEGTTGVCAASPLALIGASTAASGLSLATNSVLPFGNGGATVAVGSNTNFDVCLLQSGSGRVGGVLIYVQQ